MFHSEVLHEPGQNVYVVVSYPFPSVFRPSVIDKS